MRKRTNLCLSRWERERLLARGEKMSVQLSLELHTLANLEELANTEPEMPLREAYDLSLAAARNAVADIQEAIAEARRETVARARDFRKK